MNQNPKRKNQLRRYLQLIGVAFQMGLTIYLGAYFGKWLDGYFETDGKPYTIVLILVALGVSLWSILTQLKRINDQNE